MATADRQALRGEDYFPDTGPGLKLRRLLVIV